MQSVVVSIITINKDNKAGLEKTMRSVLSQSFLDFEYIIIDGASSDGSVDVIRHYSESSNVPIKWFSEPDTGIYNAMNKGIACAAGDYLLFLNSGDFLVDGDVLKNVFSSVHSADLLLARCRVSRDGNVVWISPLLPDTITLGTLYWNGIMHQSTFIKRSLFYNIGMYDESFRWLADIQFWYKSLIINDATTESIDLVTSDYNTDGTSSSSQKNQQFIYEREWPSRQPVLKHVLPDYVRWKSDKAIVAKYGWIDNHKVLQRLLKGFRKIIE